MKDIIRKILREHNKSFRENITPKLISTIETYLKTELNDESICRLDIQKNEHETAFDEYDLTVDLGFKNNSDRYKSQKIINFIWDMCNNKFNISTYVDVSYRFNSDCEEQHYGGFSFN